MIRSMTGFGRSDGAAGEGGYAVEVRSTNHRFGEVVCRLPRDLGGLDGRIKQAVKSHLQRGRVEVFVARTGAVVDGPNPSPRSAGSSPRQARGYRPGRSQAWRSRF